MLQIIQPKSTLTQPGEYLRTGTLLESANFMLLLPSVVATISLRLHDD
jgi:hypothetical protein